MTNNQPVKIAEWFPKLRAALAENPDATSAMIGAPERGGVMDFDQSAIVFGVPKKGQINVREIPKQWRGMETDVQTHNPGNKPELSKPGVDLSRIDTTAQFDQLAPGMSIGRLTEYGAGTLGMIVWDIQSGLPRILTNDHVLPGPIGLEVTQPALGEAVNPSIVGRKLYGTQSVFDYAISELYPGIKYTNVPLGHFNSIAGTAAAKVGQIIHKMGRTTKKTTGRIIAIGVVAMQKKDRTDYVWGAKIKPIDATNADNLEVSMAGDSGSVWFDDEQRAVGLHFAGELNADPAEELGIACPMIDLLSHAKCTIGDPRGEDGINRRAMQYKLDRVREMTQKIDRAVEEIKITADEIEMGLE